MYHRYNESSYNNFKLNSPSLAIPFPFVRVRFGLSGQRPTPLVFRCQLEQQQLEDQPRPSAYHWLQTMVFNKVLSYNIENYFFLVHFQFPVSINIIFFIETLWRLLSLIEKHKFFQSGKSRRCQIIFDENFENWSIFLRHRAFTEQ